MSDSTRFLEQTSDKIGSLDGYFNITTDENGIYVTVYPPQGDGQPVKVPQIVDSLAGQGVNKADNVLLMSIVKEALGTPVKVADKPVETEPDIQILVSRDRMEATLQVNAPKGCRPISLDEVMNKIKDAGIVYGIDGKAVEAALARPGSTVVCAKGLSPVNGSNATITYFIDLESKGRPVELEDGRVDFKNLNMFITVQQDQLLAEKVPATSGTAGIDILGNEVPAKPGKDIMLPKGKNVYITDGLKVSASQAGQLLVVNNKVNVIQLIEVKGDVDLSTGNIEFVGSVIVKGSIQTGFSVKAEGDVEIAGNVSGGIVEGKNVIVRMGIQGMNKGYIKASETVVAKYIENATVQAGKDVIVSDVILHSKVSAGKRVVVEERRGLIVGGLISAGEEIKAKTIGTYSATNTDIEVGVNPALREEYQKLRKEIKKYEFNLEQTQKALNLLRAMDQSTMPKDKYEMLLKLTKAQFHLIGQTETMRNRLAEIEIALEEMRYGHIKVSDTVYPGVKLVVGTLVKPVRDPVKFASFYAEDGEIKTGSFK
ncbi:DUF342 domain-containing protein [Sporomusa acidovorans]|uniref:Flagellar Assembly Protein A N-terminal region domain-containing protein n=1 Tax=Sporomusa acidovorans (strain ATCC 49682 / DSM 3132 / Mol) TaxID=1123286 RepID=A0ABZ3J2M0_SPOA4|nr:FapA family protein [Sporomusa acidovorans]OZC20091.1 hypothetical protein SPACI_24890 [Sporomusa acidovorans DSM 3132]SDD45489.1 hypothetical protein SAMN04488499_1001300 [Sporomusa acidovorans]